MHLHERWDCQGSIGELRGHIDHYSFQNIFDQVQRNNSYSSLGAEHLVESGTVFSAASLVLKPISKFIETYILKFGFLDGFPGLIISGSAAYSVFLKWAKVWEIQSEKKAIAN